MKLTDQHPIFVGYKIDGALRRRLESLTGSDRRYVSSEDPTFLTVLRLGDDDYVGKLIAERFTTDRVDDIRRNVLSILQRVSPDTRFPQHFDILVAIPSEEGGPRS